MYELGDVLPTDGPTQVPTGTNLLIVGEPMTGKRTLAMEMLADDDHNDGVVIITTETTASDAVEEYCDIAGNGRGRLRVIGASGEEAGNTAGSGIETVSSPSDLTGIGISLDKSIEDLEGRVDGLRLGFDSLSTLLAFVDVESVYKFVHVLTTRMSNLGSCTVCTLNTATVADERAIGMLKNPFDCVIELRESGTDREARIIGLDDIDTDWRPIRR
ncbi:MAG: RAD55 family ATPase [Halobacteriales archaeon]